MPKIITDIGPIVIVGDTANDLFIDIAKTMLAEGTKRTARGLETIELRNVWLVLNNPSASVVTLPARAINHEYLKAELDWYMAGDPHVEKIAKASSFWTKLADTNGTVNSNYGKLIMTDKWAGKSQFEWCIARLKEDPESRQAVLNYNQPVHKYEGNKDFVCTLTQQFLIDNGALHSTVHMRSNDLIYGATYDIPWFVAVQALVADALDIPLGSYNHVAASLHVYKKHFKMLERIAVDGKNF